MFISSRLSFLEYRFFQVLFCLRESCRDDRSLLYIGSHLKTLDQRNYSVQINDSPPPLKLQNTYLLQNVAFGDLGKVQQPQSSLQLVKETSHFIPSSTFICCVCLAVMSKGFCLGLQLSLPGLMLLRGVTGLTSLSKEGNVMADNVQMHARFTAFLHTPEGFHVMLSCYYVFLKVQNQKHTSKK